MASAGTFGSTLPLAFSVTMEPESTVCVGPALGMGGWIGDTPSELASAGDASKLAHGLRCPAAATDASYVFHRTYGPEPSARNGNSWKVSGLCVLPRIRLSGKMTSKS